MYNNHDFSTQNAPEVKEYAPVPKSPARPLTDFLLGLLMAIGLLIQLSRSSSTKIDRELHSKVTQI